MLCRSKAAWRVAVVAGAALAAATAQAQTAAQVALIQPAIRPTLAPAAAAAAAAPSIPAAPVAAAASVADPAAPLLNATRDWVAREQGVGANPVQVTLVDPRVQVRTCEGGFAFDLPFSTAETVRARCSNPVWQVFVRASVGRPVPTANRAPAWAPVSAAASANPAGTSAARPLPAVSSPVAVPGPAAAAGPQAPSPPVELRPVVVSAGPLLRGEPLDASDIKLVQMPASQVVGRVLGQMSEALHTELLRDLPAGTPIRPSDVRPILLVKKGQMVTLSIHGDNRFVISAQLEALQDGKMGEQIKLKNPESGRIVSGVVQGPNSVLGGGRGL